jgi:nicotinamidase-related amidase
MSSPSPLPHPDSAALLVVDIQERLLPAMSPDDQANLLKATKNLVALFGELGGRIAYSEQYPRGLGSTVPDLAGELAAVSGATRFEKTAFSVCQEAGAAEIAALSDRRDVVLVGMETHVCVLLTGLDLIARGHRVFVPHDAVASRTAANRDNGLALLEKNGATIVNSETLVFHALGKAGGDRFKRFSQRIR